MAQRPSRCPVVGELIGRPETPEEAEEASRRELERHARREARKSGVSLEAPAGSAWESVQIARNVHRPTARRYIDGIVEGFIELHGDRAFADDGAILAGIGWISGHPVTIIAQEKGVNLADRVARNFGCPQPEGYRKSLRLMREAEKFGRPILCLVDTQVPSAAPRPRSAARATPSPTIWWPWRALPFRW